MPSVSPKQKRFMAAVAHNQKFAKKVGVPQKVGKEFNAADQAVKRISQLKRKFAKGGEVKRVLKALKGPGDVLPRTPTAAERAESAALMDRLRDDPTLWRSSYVSPAKKKVSKEDPEIVKRRNLNLSTFAEGGKVGGLRTIGRLMAKYGEKGAGGAKPLGPLHVDNYGQEYGDIPSILHGVVQHLFEESDEPNFQEAFNMLKKVPGSENAQNLVMNYARAYNDPKQDMASVGRLEQAVQAAIQQLSAAPPPVQKSKGGSIKQAMEALKNGLTTVDRRAVRDKALQPTNLSWADEVRRRREPKKLDPRLDLSDDGPGMAKGGPVKGALKRLKAIGSADLQKKPYAGLRVTEDDGGHTMDHAYTISGVNKSDALDQLKKTGPGWSGVTPLDTEFDSPQQKAADRKIKLGKPRYKGSGT